MTTETKKGTAAADAARRGSPLENGDHGPDAVAFVAKMRECPKDTLPMLVFADWLDENGDIERATALRALGWAGLVGLECGRRRPSELFAGRFTPPDSDGGYLDSTLVDWLAGIGESAAVPTSWFVAHMAAFCELTDWTDPMFPPPGSPGDAHDPVSARLMLMEAFVAADAATKASWLAFCEGRAAPTP